MYFVDRPGEVISKDELMTIWNAQYVMEHSLTRVISTLRKKLDNLNNLASLIKTIPREGYKYNGLAIIENRVKIENSTSQITSTTTNKVNKIIGIFIFGVILLAVVISWVWSYEVDSSPSAQPSIFEIMDNLVLKEDASMNPDGETLVYSSQAPSGSWYLKVVSLNSQFSWQHKQEGYELIAPAWLNEEELVYIMSNNKHCSIRKINIYKAPENSIGIPISSCNVKAPSGALTVLDSKRLLVSDSEDISIPKQLFIINIDTGEKKVFHNDNLQGSGVYRVFTSPNKKFIATLSSKNWFDTDIQIFEVDRLTVPHWEKKVNYPLFSIAFSDKGLVFKDEIGRFKVIDYLSGSEQNQSAIPLIITRPVYSPTYAKNGFFFTEGDKFSHKIVRVNLANTENEVLNQISGASARTPLLIEGGQVLLYSSNQTGINQIWKKNLLSGKHEQISNFNISYFIEKIVVNDTETEIAIGTNKSIVLGLFDVTGKIIVQEFVNGSFPSFLRGNLLYSKKKNGKRIVYQYNKENKSSAILIENGAYKTINDNDKLFYSKYHSSGIWQYHEAAPDTIVHSEVSSYIGEDWDIFDGFLYIRNLNNNISKVNIRENNNEPIETLKNICSKIYIVADEVCISSIGEASINRLLKYNFN
jgi:hypothetical protein